MKSPEMMENRLKKLQEHVLVAFQIEFSDTLS